MGVWASRDPANCHLMSWKLPFRVVTPSAGAGWPSHPLVTVLSSMFGGWPHRLLIKFDVCRVWWLSRPMLSWLRWGYLPMSGWLSHPVGRGSYPFGYEFYSCPSCSPPRHPPSLPPQAGAANHRNIGRMLIVIFRWSRNFTVVFVEKSGFLDLFVWNSLFTIVSMCCRVGFVSIVSWHYGRWSFICKIK
jgi:hypothetical protein